MNSRLQQFLAAENITQAEFADTIRVARASVSHILAGRNKPGFDFIANTMKNYPALNIEWLIEGKGKMYKADMQPSAVQGAASSYSPPASGGIFGSFSSQEEDGNLFNQTSSRNDGENTPDVLSEPSREMTRMQNSVQMPASSPDIEFLKTSQPLQDMVQPVARQRKAIKITVFYDDNTFEEFVK